MNRAVTSLTNPTVKAVRALHMRKEREETGLFLAEGLKVITERGSLQGIANSDNIDVRRNTVPVGVKKL